MPEVVHEKPNRLPLFAALAVVAVVVVAVVVAVFVIQRADAEKQAFEKAKNLAVASDERGDFKSSAKTLQAYLDSNPPKKYADEIYLTLGSAYTNAGEYSRAVDMYKKADEVNPKNHKAALSGLASAHASAGEKEAALGYYRQLIELSEKEDAAYSEMEIKGYNNEIRNLEEGSR